MQLETSKSVKNYPMIMVLDLMKIIKISRVNAVQKNCVGYIVREGPRWRNKKTEIDIILPNYNSWLKICIDETIRSVLNQSFYKSWKLIIIDDCLQHLETRKKLKKYEKSKKIKIYWLKKK